MTQVLDRRAAPAAAGGTFSQVVRSEVTKFFSVRSTLWTLLGTVVFTVGFAALISWGTASSYDQLSPADKATFDATGISLAGLAFGQLAIAVLGVMIISSEYSTGGIRTTLTAVPRRLRVLAAKGVVLAAVSFLVGLASCFAAFFVGQAFLATKNLDVSLGDPHVLRAVIGGALYVTGSALFGFAIGAVLRHTAGAVTATVAILLVLPPLSNLLPGGWGDAVTRYFTSNAGSRVFSVVPSSNTLGPWSGYAAFTVEWAVVLAAGAVLLVRRDA